jgi:uncharacterized NAD(P)/FAD-binding protein YdhS
MTSIAIIGAGFSGLLTAIHLLKTNLTTRLHIYLIDQNPRIGRGLAYGTWDDNFLLNVPVGNMSAIYDDPQHFLRYCQQIDPSFNEGSFVSRRIYGDYLEDLLTHSIKLSQVKLQIIQETVNAVKKESGNQFSIHFKTNPPLLADKVVLAFGHFSSANPMPKKVKGFTSKEFKTTHDLRWLFQSDNSHPVVIIGSGLTAVDTIFKLSSSGVNRKIILISRRGLLPQPHRTNPKAPAKNTFVDLLRIPKTVRAYLRAIRLEIAHRENEGGNWRDVINELRPFTPKIWQLFPNKERLRFIRHVLPYWDTHRHRLAPIAHKRLLNLISNGQVEVLAARITDVTPMDYGWCLHAHLRQQQSNMQINTVGIINCTSPNGNIKQINDPLIHQLYVDELISEDLLHLGIVTQQDYQTIDRKGNANLGVYYVGPMLKASYWEAIAVPELREHTAKLSKIILESISTKLNLLAK